MFDYKKLKEEGYFIMPDQISNELIEKLKQSLDNSFKLHSHIQKEQGNEIDVTGVALNVVGDSVIYIHLLQELFDNKIIENLEKHFFKSKFILNSMSALDNQPNKINFSAVVHRDIKCYSGQLPIMINLLVMLDDFTIENGATSLLPYSHMVEEKPDDLYYKKNSIRATGKAGDILFFNSNVWHSSELNSTQERRRGIPITFSKSFVKQLMDYPRCLGYGEKHLYSNQMAQLLGYDSRVPANLYEWYQPFENRLYKKEQD
jgi:ectoine hydroxylase-related dioxygenase (phytanoyl-CoA dioxygenase family)